MCFQPFSVSVILFRWFLQLLDVMRRTSCKIIQDRLGLWQTWGKLRLSWTHGQRNFFSSFSFVVSFVCYRLTKPICLGQELKALDIEAPNSTWKPLFAKGVEKLLAFNNEEDGLVFFSLCRLIVTICSYLKPITLAGVCYWIGVNAYQEEKTLWVSSCWADWWLMSIAVLMAELLKCFSDVRYCVSLIHTKSQECSSFVSWAFES